VWELRFPTNFFKEGQGSRLFSFPDLVLKILVDDVENSMKERLSIKKLVCTRLKTKFNTYTYFRVLVVEDEFPLVNNIGGWHRGCLLAPFCSKLTPWSGVLLKHTRHSPIVLIGAAEVTIIPPDCGFEPRGISIFFIKMSGDLEQNVEGSLQMFTLLITKYTAILKPD
jgi:hypothetical protein